MHKQPSNYRDEGAFYIIVFVSYLRAGRPGQGFRCQDAALSSGFETPQGRWFHSHTWGSCTS